MAAGRRTSLGRDLPTLQILATFTADLSCDDWYVRALSVHTGLCRWSRGRRVVKTTDGSGGRP